MENRIKNNILIVEDDAETRRLLSMYLEADNYTVEAVSEGAEALSQLKHNHFDLVILDLQLPDISGIDVCKQLKHFFTGPILILTGCSDPFSEVCLLKFGADDYLVKPSQPDVISARVGALLRRFKRLTCSDSNPRLKSMDVDLANQKVTFQGKLINLTTSEFEVLHFLARNAGSVISRSTLCESLRGIEHDSLDRSIDMRISGLRKKLGDEASPHQVIKTVRNKGYLLVNE